MEMFVQENLLGLLVAGVGGLIILFIFGRSALRVAAKIAKSALIGFVVTAVIHFGAKFSGHEISVVFLSTVGLFMTVISFFFLPAPEQ